MAAQFLKRAAEIIPGNQTAQMLLKSYYLSRLQKILRTEPSKHSVVTQNYCEKCLTPWTDNNYQINLKRPKKISKNAKRIVLAYETNSKQLSKAKLMMAKKWKNKIHNKVTSTCNLCKHTVKTVLRTAVKKSHKIPKKSAEIPPSDEPLIDIKTVELIRPKKRKKDKFAGLNIRPKDDGIKESKPNYVIQSIAETKPQKAQPKLPQLKGKQKPKQKQKLTKTVKDLSATKQRNNMLLLANVLKINEAKKVKMNFNSGLDKMLK